MCEGSLQGRGARGEKSNTTPTLKGDRPTTEKQNVRENPSGQGHEGEKSNTTPTLKGDRPTTEKQNVRENPSG
jgi:hypothetical protein